LNLIVKEHKNFDQGLHKNHHKSLGQK